MLKFPEMPYERPDIEAAKQFLAQAAARLEAAESFEAADAVFVEVNGRSTQLDTMFTISHIRHDINTEDKFYDAEVEFADAALSGPKKYSAQGQAKNSMDMEWTSQASREGHWHSPGTMKRPVKLAKAWPASCVMTSTSCEVPLKLAKMKGQW